MRPEILTGIIAGASALTGASIGAFVPIMFIEQTVKVAEREALRVEILRMAMMPSQNIDPYTALGLTSIALDKSDIENINRTFDDQKVNNIICYNYWIDECEIISAIRVNAMRRILGVEELTIEELNSYNRPLFDHLRERSLQAPDLGRGRAVQ